MKGKKEMTSDRNMSTTQYLKWLLTCGLLPYEPKDVSQVYKDESQMDVLVASEADTDGVFEVSLSNSETDGQLQAEEVTSAAGENEQFKLIAKKARNEQEDQKLRAGV